MEPRDAVTRAGMTSADASEGLRAPAADFGLKPTCDMCGLGLTPEDTYTTELTAQGATCPTAMTLHKACYEAASALWQPDEDGPTCDADPLFPETGQWNQIQRAADDTSF